MAHDNDPRDHSLESSFTLPQTWRAQDNLDGLATSGMFLAGLIMVTRNRILAWPSLLLSLSAWINQHPLRTREGSTPPIGNLMFAVVALIASYIPHLVRSGPPAAAAAAAAKQVPLNL